MTEVGDGPEYLSEFRAKFASPPERRLYAVLCGFGVYPGPMVLDTQIPLGPILGFIGGIGGKLVYDVIARWRRRRIEERENKIAWYQDLTALSKEIKFATYGRTNTFDYFQQEASLTDKSITEVLSEEEMERVRAELEERGIEDPEQFAEKRAFEEWAETKERVQERIRADMNLYEERLLRHLAQYPEDTNPETLETAATVVRKINAAGTIGRLNEEYMGDVEETANRLISLCSTEIEQID